MLIVAAPKSMSTSIMEGIAGILGLAYAQQFGLRDRFGSPEEFALLPHSDMAFLPPAKIQEWADAPCVYKQHLLPLPTHAEALKGRKIVVLTRSPEGILDAYGRSHHGKPVSDAANAEVVLEQITRYVEGLSMFEGLRIAYEEAVADNAGAMNAILEYWGSLRRVSEHYRLPKTRYTR